MELIQTTEMMISEDYIERFKAEYYQTKIRYEKLKNMVNRWDKNELNFIPICPRYIYDFQLRAMESYLTVLKERAKIENINLNI